MTRARILADYVAGGTTAAEFDYMDGVTSNVQTQMDTKAPLASPPLSGVPTTPTASASTNTTQIASTAYVRAEVAALVDTAPANLDTLNELAAALGDDNNYATTTTSALSGKAAKAGDTFTGAVIGTTFDASTDFTVGGLVITDATITDNGTLTITATTGITLGQDTALSAGKDLETSTTGKIKQKGAFMQSSTHQALTLGY
jgi:hypothetical protein